MTCCSQRLLGYLDNQPDPYGNFTTVRFICGNCRAIWFVRGPLVIQTKD